MRERLALCLFGEEKSILLLRPSFGFALAWLVFCYVRVRMT
jgi:hypothetical protein